MSFIRVCTKCCQISRSSSYASFLMHRTQRLAQRLYSSMEAISHPTPDGIEKVYPDKIRNIVDQIAKLTLIEAVDLNDCLKKTLNIKDIPMSMGMMPAAPSKPAEDQEAEPVVVKTSFTVKLLNFDSTKKLAVVKEIKAQIEGMNLVQAKKFVEDAPQVVRADIAKDEAETLKKALEAAGATCEIC